MRRLLAVFGVVASLASGARAQNYPSPTAVFLNRHEVTLASTVTGSTFTTNALYVTNDATFGNGVSGTSTTFNQTLKVSSSPLIVDGSGGSLSVQGSNLSVDANQLSTSKPLTVSSSGTFVSNAPIVLIASGTSSDTSMTVGSYGAAGAAKLDIQTLTHEYFWQTANGISDDFRLYDQTSGAERLRVTKGGNFGLGTATPLARLTNASDLSQAGPATFGSSTTINAAMLIWPRTKAQLLAITPANTGEMYYCTDCSPKKIVQSTGTSAGNFADAIGGAFQ